MRKPKILTKEANKYWLILKKIVADDMEPGDEHLLGVFANTYHIHERALAGMMEKGVTLPGNMVRQNPAFQIYKETEKMIESLSVHFGMSPKARKAVFKTKEDSEEDPIESLKSEFGKD